MNIVGLGQCGCNIAKCFDQYPQYKVYLFDSEERKHKNFRLLKKQSSHKGYEENFPKFRFKPKYDETIFFCASSGKITGASLCLLHHFKETQIRCVLIIPGEDEMPTIYEAQHKLIFNAMQDYARSGVFKDIVFILNESLENSIPDLTFFNKYDKINEVLCYMFHMFNVFENTEPISKTKFFSKEHCRILSVGSYDYKKNKENMYFSLDNENESCYYISIPRKVLETDTKLIRTIKNNFKEKENYSYQIYSNNLEYNVGFVVKRTHFNQGQNFS